MIGDYGVARTFNGTVFAWTGGWTRHERERERQDAGERRPWADSRCRGGGLPQPVTGWCLEDEENPESFMEDPKDRHPGAASSTEGARPAFCLMRRCASQAAVGSASEDVCGATRVIALEKQVIRPGHQGLPLEAPPAAMHAALALSTSISLSFSLTLSALLSFCRSVSRPCALSLFLSLSRPSAEELCHRDSS